MTPTPTATPVPAPSARIDTYSPSKTTTVSVGQSVTLSVSFTNAGNVSWLFVAGATVWNARGDQVANYSSTLSSPLAVGQQTTVSWSHSVSQAGEYWVQFGVWKATPFIGENLLDKEPSPSQKLIVGRAPPPQITSVSPVRPKAQATRQWLTIQGSGFVSQSQVTLRIGASQYPIPSDRTQFVTSSELRVYVGLTDPGTWSAQVSNPDGQQSNVFSFQVLP